MPDLIWAQKLSTARPGSYLNGDFYGTPRLEVANSSLLLPRKLYGCVHERILFKMK